MTRRVNIAVDNSFKGGLITEATGINFPQDACTESYNCVHDEKGRTKRRYGFDYEANYTTQAVATGDNSISGYTWNNVAGDGSLSIRVQQVGDTLYFYNITTSASLSENIISNTSDVLQTVDLNTYAVSANDPALNECQYAAGTGYLVVVHPQCEPFYVVCDPETFDITTTQITPKIRDLEGLDDGYAVTDRPTASVGTLTTEHKYNLFNQGWYFDSNAALTAWDTSETTMPSNADVWWLFKNSSGAFDATTIPNVYTGNAPAPKGHYILDLFNQDRTTASGISSITTVTTGSQRFSTSAFMNGRIFYAGLNYSGFSSNIYFTRIIETKDQLGICYQENDPTAEDNSDLLSTDGGVIKITDIQAVVKLVPLVNVLLVFATNGIWAITGSVGTGFSPADFTVTKISSISALGASSFIDIDGFPAWWNLDGIYVLKPSDDTGSSRGFVVESLTDTTIRTFYNDIPSKSQKLAKGVYNPLEKIARWVYKSEDASGPETEYKFDRVLSFNFLTGAWYPWTIDITNVAIHDVVLIKGEGGVQGVENVTTEDGFIIQDQTGDPVTSFGLTRFVIAPRFKFFVSKLDDSGATRSYTFAESRSTTYLDWYSYDTTGTDYESTFTVGYKIHGDTQRFFQANYVFVFLEQETNATCYMQGLWEFTTSADSNRWSTAQNVYNSALTNRAVNFRRLKVRGKGRALQLKFTSDTGRPFTILGWSLFETQNASI